VHKLKYFPHKLDISPHIQGEKVPLWFFKLFLKEHSIHVYNQGAIKMVVKSFTQSQFFQRTSMFTIFEIIKNLESLIKCWSQNQHEYFGCEHPLN
jgi:hypothetical protein